MPLATALLLSGLLVPGFNGCEDEPDPSRVPELSRLLGSQAAKVRAEAAEQLGHIGPEARSAVPSLVALLGDSTSYERLPLIAWSVSFTVETALEQIGVEAVPALVDALKSDDAKIALGAARVLGEIGPRARTALPALVRRLDSEDGGLRWTILHSISRIDSSGRRAIPLLIARLHDDSEYVRAQSAELLAGYGRRAEPAVPELLKALKDPQPRVRGAAAKSLARIGTSSEEAIPRLAELLDDYGTYWVTHSSHTAAELVVAYDAVDALAVSGRPEAVPHLVKALRDPDFRSPALVDALIRLGAPAQDVWPAVIQAIDAGNVWSARNVANAAAGIRDAVPELKKRLDSDDENVRLGAAVALLFIQKGHGNAEREIVLSALDTNGWRSVVVSMLGELGPAAQFAVPTLVTMLEDEHQQLERDVAALLGKIGPAAKPAGPILIRHLDWSSNYEPVTKALLGIGPAMVPLLIHKLESNPDSAEFRVGLLQALAAFGPQAGSAVPALVAALEDRCRSVRVAAAAALRHVRTGPERAVPALTRALRDPRPAVRSEAARSLAHYGPDAAPAIDPLAAALADEYLDVRLSAAEALARLGPTARPALPALRQAAESPHDLLRDTARHAISRIRI